MKFEEGYQKYLVLSEKNGTTDNLSTDKSRFAVDYNIAQNKVIEWFIEAKSSDENRYLQSIKIPSERLVLKATELDYTSFSLPSNYFDFINIKVLGSKGSCQNKLFKSTEVKGENVYIRYSDSNLDPSFKYRETFHTIENNAIQVYKKDFEISSVNLSYYRYPNQVKLENPDNPESSFLNESFEFDDKLTNRIILAAVSLHNLSEGDGAYQAFKQETIQKF